MAIVIVGTLKIGMAPKCAAWLALTTATTTQPQSTSNFRNYPPSTLSARLLFPTTPNGGLYGISKSQNLLSWEKIYCKKTFAPNLNKIPFPFSGLAFVNNLGFYFCSGSGLTIELF